MSARIVAAVSFWNSEVPSDAATIWLLVASCSREGHLAPVFSSNVPTAPFEGSLRCQENDRIDEGGLREMKAKRMSFGAVGALSALLSLLLFVAACSGDDGDADPTATEPAAADPTAAEPAAGEPTATEPATEPSAVETSVDVRLIEFAVEPSVDSVPAGAVTFNASSEGVIFHNFKVIATDLAPDALPVDDALFAVDEEQVDIVANTADLNPGEQETLTVELAAGSYVLICNVPTHYGAGMTVAFTVE